MAGLIEKKAEKASTKLNPALDCNGSVAYVCTMLAWSSHKWLGNDDVQAAFKLACHRMFCLASLDRTTNHLEMQ